jgi:hypothetical protein
MSYFLRYTSLHVYRCQLLNIIYAYVNSHLRIQIIFQRNYIMILNLFIYLFIYLVVLGFELKALHLLGRHTTILTTPPALPILNFKILVIYI